MKDLYWIGSVQKDLKKFPEDVRDEIAFSLHVVRGGKTPDSAKKFRISREHGVYEIVSNYDTNTYRVVYVIKIDERVYVLDAFQKKSKRGIQTPQQDVNRIKNRLARAKEISKKYKQNK